MTFRAQLFALCFLAAYIAHGVPIPAAPSSLVLYSGVTATATAAETPTALPTSIDTLTSTLLVTVTQTEISTRTISATLPALDTLETDHVATATSSAPLSHHSTDSPALVTAALPAPTHTSAWSADGNYDGGDFSAALAVKKWAWGKDNVAVVSGIPSSAWAPTASATETTSPRMNAAHRAFPRVDLTNSTMLQVEFPQGSINPGNKSLPTGGLGAYLTPLNLSSASNVTLTYSVFFPSDFDFVKGGKLPGLYGGHEGCSGGAESEDCFSTRIMWRTNGKGELYLYAPRDVQPVALCNTPPLSYCDTSYGMSIGRGAWAFERGAWSTVKQTIKLNTPGVADGAFEILVNDVLVLSSRAVVFRKDFSGSSTTRSPKTTPPPSKPSKPTSTKAPKPQTTSTVASGGLLGGLLNELGLGNILIDAAPISSGLASDIALAGAPPTATEGDIPVFTPPSHLLLPPIASSNPALSALSAKASPAPAAPASNAGIAGIMLHTFFGGSDPSWASPRDQYLYLDRLSLVVNA
ncbi:hypothetical protein JCM10207_006035 [Rhodosporidiobolus poonsookiae]